MTPQRTARNHQECHHILAREYYSAYRLWHPLQDLFHPNSRQKPLAVTTVYSVTDDGRKGRPKHVELLTPNKEHKKLHLVGIYEGWNFNSGNYLFTTDTK